ncbi:carbohydrate ABC transporter permease [Bradyrhizobium sp.]|uniref:carbohydrate ABC transporter permease n=2 Tax=Bradyrhizobium TaxID=374 RepID=UPI0035A0BA6A
MRDVGLSLAANPRQCQRSMTESRLNRTLCLILIGVASFASLLPIVLAVMNALKTTVEISTNPLAPPRQLHWENFTSAWNNAALGPSLLHTAEVAALTIVMVCATAAPCAYVLARQRGRGFRLLTFYFMASITIPVQLYLYPLYFIFAKLGLVNSIPAVALIYTAMFSPFSIFLLRTYVVSIPYALEEASEVDGATAWQKFYYVVLPMMRPGLLTVAIIVGLNAWNEFVIAVTFLQNDSNVTAIVKFYNLTGQYSTDWGEMLAAAVIIVLPVVLAFVLLQRRFIDGMTAGAVKS